MSLVEPTRLVFWQNIPSPLQAPLIRELSKQWVDSVIVVTEGDLPTKRRLQGWSRPDFGPAYLTVSPSMAERRQILSEHEDDSIHVFSGFHADADTYATFRAAVQQGLRVAVFAEAARPGGVWGALRYLRYRIHGARWNSHLEFMLATGATGVEWYRRTGFSNSQIFPFAYFVDAGDSLPVPVDRVGRELRLLYVGQLIRRKGVDILLRAIADLNDSGWRLDLVGTGPERAALETLSRRLSIAGRLKWRGTLPNPEVRCLMQRVDCLVLPSRFDGWGAVVNEALLGGTPVVVSDACGASDFIANPQCGDIFTSGVDAELRQILKRRIAQGPPEQRFREALARWALRAISASAGAHYLNSILEFLRGGRVRPSPPWRRSGTRTPLSSEL